MPATTASPAPRRPETVDARARPPAKNRSNAGWTHWTDDSAHRRARHDLAATLRAGRARTRGILRFRDLGHRLTGLAVPLLPQRRPGARDRPRASGCYWAVARSARTATAPPQAVTAGHRGPDRRAVEDRGPRHDTGNVSVRTRTPTAADPESDAHGTRTRHKGRLVGRGRLEAALTDRSSATTIPRSAAGDDLGGYEGTSQRLLDPWSGRARADYQRSSTTSPPASPSLSPDGPVWTTPASSRHPCASSSTYERHIGIDALTDGGGTRQQTRGSPENYGLASTLRPPRGQPRAELLTGRSAPAGGPRRPGRGTEALDRLVRIFHTVRPAGRNAPGPRPPRTAIARHCRNLRPHTWVRTVPRTRRPYGRTASPRRLRPGAVLYALRATTWNSARRPAHGPHRPRPPACCRLPTRQRGTPDPAHAPARPPQQDLVMTQPPRTDPAHPTSTSTSTSTQHQHQHQHQHRSSAPDGPGVLMTCVGRRTPRRRGIGIHGERRRRRRHHDAVRAFLRRHGSNFAYSASRPAALTRPRTNGPLRARLRPLFRPCPPIGPRLPPRPS